MKLDDEVVALKELDWCASRPVHSEATRLGWRASAPSLGEHVREDVEGQRDWWAD